MERASEEVRDVWARVRHDALGMLREGHTVYDAFVVPRTPVVRGEDWASAHVQASAAVTRLTFVFERHYEQFTGRHIDTVITCNGAFIERLGPDYA